MKYMRQLFWTLNNRQHRTVTDRRSKQRGLSVQLYGGTIQIAVKGGQSQEQRRRRGWNFGQVRCLKIWGSELWGGGSCLKKELENLHKGPWEYYVKYWTQTWRLRLHEAGQKTITHVNWGVSRTHMGLGDVYILVNCSKESLLKLWGTQWTHWRAML